MTKKHFTEIANRLKAVYHRWDGHKQHTIHAAGFDLGWAMATESIADSLADYFESENVRFDREKFLTACDVAE